MKRRSFFGMVGAVFGGLGLLTRVVPRLGFKQSGQSEAFHYYPMKAGFYKPGDTFEIIGPGGRGTAPLRKVDSIE